jgi:ATP-dependent exoDNAse (exonuclease V) beta subunit
MKQDFFELKPAEGAKDGHVYLWEVPANQEHDSFLAECHGLAQLLKTIDFQAIGAQSLKDIAVIAPRNDWLEQAATVLKSAGIPTCILSLKETRRFRPEYSWPLALIKVILEPKNRFEIIGLLREWFIISDKEIELFVKEHGKEWSLDTEIAETYSSEFKNAFALLKKLRTDYLEQVRSKTFYLCDFLDYIWKESGLIDRLQALELSLKPLDNYRLETRNHDDWSLEEFLEEQMIHLEQRPEMVGDANGVQLLTCQKAKGLEWPVIIALGLDKTIRDKNREYPGFVKGLEDYELILSSPHDELSEHLRQKRYDEYQRFFYVLCTRAQNALIFLDNSQNITQKKGEKSSFADLSYWEDRKEEFAFEILPYTGNNPLLNSQSEKNQVKETLKPSDFDLLNQTPARILPHTQVTKKEWIEKSDQYELPLDSDEVLFAGADYGIWWHETIESFPWKGSSEKQKAYADKALEVIEQFSHKQRAEKELNAFLEGSFLKDLLANSETYLIELPFSFVWQKDKWSEGVIDFVVKQKDGSVLLLDWKTNTPTGSKDFDKDLLDTYKGQLALYREILEKHAGMTISEVALYSTYLGKKLVY